MFLDSHQTKLFIKVDGVIGDRRRICIFCNNSIHGAEKIVETTRKLRRGPYFPQLAHLQSSVGKIDTMGRAIVCLPCFHQLVRQWNSYEMKNIPMSRRIYKHVADKGVKNYQETRAKEIGAEAEKRAFAIQTDQEHIVKTAFDRLSKRLDVQEEIIRQSEECIEKLKLKLALCTKGEQWKIDREIRKQQKIIAATEARIEDEEDKEELIRRETKSLLEVYKQNQSLFRAVSEPNLFQSNLEHTAKEKPIVFDRVSEQQVESSQQSGVDSSANMNRNQHFRENEYNYDDNGGYTVVKAMRISQSEDETDSYRPKAHVQNDGRDVWNALELSREYVQKEPVRDNSDWHMTKEIIHPARSIEVQSFPEDEWSKLFDKEQNDYENQYESGNTVRSSVTWSPQRNKSPDGTEWRQNKGDFVEREDQQWDETVNTDDSDDEKEQIYEVNAHPSNNSQFQSRDISDSRHVVRSISPPNRTWESNHGRTVNQPSFEQPTKHEYNVSSEADIDPWDMIQIEKERGQCSPDQGERSEPQDYYSPDNVGSEYYEDDYIDEYNQDNFERDDKEILSPRRLDSGRFSQFTKSSYISEPTRDKPLREQFRDRTMNSSLEHNGIEKNARQNDVRILESSNYVSDERTRNTQQTNVSYDPLEPLRKNRNVHDRHLSVKEEEWETKHLSPKRLDDARWVSFVNEQNMEVKPKYPAQHDVYIQEQKTRPAKSFGSKNSASDVRQADKADRGKISSTFTDTQYNMNGNNSDERNRIRFKDYPSDARSSSPSERLNEIHVERSPALKKLMKQDEISEEPVRRVTTRASVQSSPWDEIETQTNRRDSGVRNEQENETVGPDRYVGKLDLKQWSSEVERNRSFDIKSPEPLHTHNEDKTRSAAPLKQNSLRTTQEVYEDEMVIINRNKSPKLSGDVYILESKNETTFQERSVRPSSLKYKEKVNFSDENGNSPKRRTPTTPTRMQHTIVIEDNQRTTNDDDDDDYLKRKRVGKVNLSLWEQNATSQSDNNSSSATDMSPHENRSESMSPRGSQSSVTLNGSNSSQFDNSQQYTNTSSNRKSDINAQERKHANNPGEDSTNSNRRSFNKSMSEDELAWEKRFNKTYERKISVEEPKEEIKQRKVSDQKIPRLSDGNVENENYFNFGKISLDEDEVRRVRENKTNIGNKTNYRNEDTYITPKSFNDRNNVNRQSSNSPKPSQNTKYARDCSQLTEDEFAWEEKTSRPGRLDFSRFLQFK